MRQKGKRSAHRAGTLQKGAGNGCSLQVELIRQSFGGLDHNLIPHQRMRCLKLLSLRDHDAGATQTQAIIASWSGTSIAHRSDFGHGAVAQPAQNRLDTPKALCPEHFEQALGGDCAADARPRGSIGARNAASDR